MTCPIAHSRLRSSSYQVDKQEWQVARLKSRLPARLISLSEDRGWAARIHFLWGRPANFRNRDVLRGNHGALNLLELRGEP
jgi:hypothetical protein